MRPGFELERGKYTLGNPIGLISSRLFHIDMYGTRKRHGDDDDSEEGEKKAKVE